MLRATPEDVVDVFVLKLALEVVLALKARAMTRMSGASHPGLGLPTTVDGARGRPTHQGNPPR